MGPIDRQVEARKRWSAQVWEDRTPVGLAQQDLGVDFAEGEVTLTINEISKNEYIF